MGIERIFVCDCCSDVLREGEFGTGAKAWIQINGVSLNGSDNPFFCDSCKPKIMNAIDEIVEQERK